MADLEALIQFIQGAAAQDPSLANLSLVGVKKGSRVAVLKAQSAGIPGLLSPEQALSDIFSNTSKRRRKKEPLELPGGILNAFKTWTRGDAKVEVSYRLFGAPHPKKVTFQQKDIASAKTRRTKTYHDGNFTGKLVRLHSDEENFGVETINGLLLCPFPPYERESWVALYERVVCVHAKAPPSPSPAGHGGQSRPTRLRYCQIPPR